MKDKVPVFAYWHSADHTILAEFLADWRKHFPDLRVIGDADIEPLLEKILPEYVSLYRRIRFPAVKVDVARLAYLHEFGGLYLDCHCGLRTASGARELFAKLDQYELILWEHSYVTAPRPKNKMRPLNSILLARPESSIVCRFLLTALANLDAHSKREAIHGLTEYSPWRMCGPGNLSKVLNMSGSNDTRLREEFAGRISFSGIDDGPIGPWQHNAYRSDPEQHWDRRRRRELLFEPEGQPANVSSNLSTPFDAKIWSITSYYNPGRYQRRLANFHHFRKALRGPLVAVELALGHAFELSKGDADILVQIPGTSVLWQKERLLNVALRHLPQHVRYVAWLDCDVVLSDPTWPALAIEALQTHPFVQLFENLIDLDPKSSHQDGPFEYTGDSMVAFVKNGGPLRDLSLPRTRRYRPSARGGAWAGRRALLEKHGFYDALILGGGDLAFVHAAYGRTDEAIEILCLNPRRSGHYLDWAKPFFSDVQGNLAHIKGDLFHYWHGALPNRRYAERNERLRQLDFDPYTDIELDEHGSFRWSCEKPALKQYVRHYFDSRDEDTE
ncbi:MAG TPA: hypothetical protein VMV59_06120 [Candidatus Dormibacteraeota bacterium]|nr:hypothetical protein [Candidatus Dormibacteraeota bacterium]